MGLKDKSASRLAASVIVGIVLIPLSAVAAVVLTDKEPDTSTTTTTAGSLDGGSVAYTDVQASAEDLAYACGEGGLWLVELERKHGISELQQSALDALRGICSSNGMPLPGKDAPPPIVQTEVIAVGPGGSGTTTPTSMPSTTTTFDDHDEDEADDMAEYEDHEDEYEDENESGEHHEQEDEHEYEHAEGEDD